LALSLDVDVDYFSRHSEGYVYVSLVYQKSHVCAVTLGSVRFFCCLVVVAMNETSHSGEKERSNAQLEIAAIASGRVAPAEMSKMPSEDREQGDLA